MASPLQYIPHTTHTHTHTKTLTPRTKHAHTHYLQNMHTLTPHTKLTPHTCAHTLKHTLLTQITNYNIVCLKES